MTDNEAVYVEMQKCLRNVNILAKALYVNLGISIMVVVLFFLNGASDAPYAVAAVILAVLGVAMEFLAKQQKFRYDQLLNQYVWNEEEVNS